MPNLVSFIGGSLFGIGLALSGMTQPAKVVGFLDVAGDWDPSLAVVMGAAVLTYGALMKFVVRRGQPWFHARFLLPTRADLTPRLLTGSAMFGVGWGLAGYCPGPAIVSLGTGAEPTLVFFIAMLAGVVLFRFGFARMTTRREARVGG